MIDAILKAFGAVVKFLYNIGGHNYLVALILFAVVVKIVLLPLSIKQQKNQIKQAKLRPKEMAIRKKYAGRNDQPTQQKMQNEIMELYQKENFNPMGGCLPLLVQLPILLGLYQVIIKPLQYFCNVPKAAITKVLESKELLEIVGDADKIKKLSQIELIEIIKVNFDKFSSYIGEYVKAKSDLPNFNLFGLDLSANPSLNNLKGEGLILLLVPVLTFVIMFFSMKITKKFTYNPNAETADANAGCSMKIMDYMMPLMSTYITFIVPAVIGIYWIFNNLFGTLQQIILAKVMPLPKFSEEDYKNAEREMNGKSKSGKKKNGSTGEKKKVRSYHRIDEEDYEQPEVEETKPTEKATGLAGMIEKPEMKDEE